MRINSDPKFSVCLIAATLTAMIFLNSCRSTPPPAAKASAVSTDTWATVDGHDITREDVDKAYRRAPDASQSLSDDEILTAKLNLLDSLIVQEILLGKARALNLTVPDTDLDTAYNEAKKNVTDDAFQQELKQRGLTTADVREGLRRELLTQKVLDHEVTSKASIGDQEVNDFFNTNKAQFNVAEESYHVAQLVVTPVREAQVTNTSGDDATTPQAATAKVQMLMERLKGGASFRDLAMAFSEDPESAPRGGDMGLIPISRLKQAPPQLRDAVLNKAPGSVNVAAAGGAYTLMLVVAHEAAGQRDLSTPGLKDDITQTLKSRKEQLLRTAFLTAARTDAKIVNYLARRVVDSGGKMPPGQASAQH